MADHPNNPYLDPDKEPEEDKFYTALAWTIVVFSVLILALILSA